MTFNSLQSSNGIASVLSEVRSQLETIVDVEGVRELTETLPACVLLGGIAARRELIAALLGEHGVATSAAALLVAPGMRQPLALELRCGAQEFGSIHGPEAQAWLQSVAQAAQQALGNRLKLEPLRMRLSAMGCANIDVVDLPDRQGLGDSAPVPPKIDEMRICHLGSSSNLLVCLEPGLPLELCRRFDPTLRRTVLLGAAASSAQAGNGTLPPSMLCGTAAARALEERFTLLCNDRQQQWLSNLERLKLRLTKSHGEAKEVEQRESSAEVLRRARAAGLSFGRALQHIIAGAPGCTAGAFTLEEELLEFASAAVKGNCGTGFALSGEDAASAAADLFTHFDGVEGYAAYLRDSVRIPSADVSLNGGAAWQRLLAEVEVAMRLSHPPPEELAGLMLAAIRVGGTGVHGHQRWEDVASKLMLSIAYEPLRRRIRYVAARVVWVLRHQKAAISEWMSSLLDGPAANLYSPLFAEHVKILRKYPIVRDLVFNAYNDAASTVGEQVLKNLEGTLMAACISPELMLRPSTEPALDPNKPVSVPATKDERSSDARQRVAAEVCHRASQSGGMPVQLRDRVFEPSEAVQTLPFLEVKLRHAFGVLADVLANQAFAFADTSLTTLCRRQVDEAMNKIDFSIEQKQAMAAQHAELKDVADQVEVRLGAVQNCISRLRSTRA